MTADLVIRGGRVVDGTGGPPREADVAIAGDRNAAVGDADAADRFGLSADRLARMKPDAVVMHPGPLNRGLEIESAVADSPNSVILEQVAHGLAVRMACLYLTTQVSNLAPGQ